MCMVSSAMVPAAPEIFFCTVEQKPSKAKYYVDDTFEVQELLQWLANVSGSQPKIRQAFLAEHSVGEH